MGIWITTGLQNNHHIYGVLKCIAVKHWSRLIIARGEVSRDRKNKTQNIQFNLNIFKFSAYAEFIDRRLVLVIYFSNELKFFVVKSGKFWIWGWTIRVRQVLHSNMCQDNTRTQISFHLCSLQIADQKNVAFYINQSLLIPWIKPTK